MSQIENDNRAVKSHEVLEISKALGVSPLALLEESPAQTAVAARSVTSMRAAESTLIARVNQIQDLRLALPADTRQRREVWDEVPSVSGLDEFAGARVLADWVLSKLRPFEDGAGRFVGLAEELGVQFGIDVIVEPFDDDVIGAALLSREYPTIVVNATQRRQRSLFTLAHEFGHLLAGESSGVQVDRQVRAVSADERRANVFASELLLPRARVAELAAESGRKLEPTLARMMDVLDSSYMSAIYRLHNLRYIDASTRDSLLDLKRAAFVDGLEDDALRTVLLSRSDALDARAVLPTGLIGTLKNAYRAGLVSAAPIASLVGESVEDVTDILASEVGSADYPDDLLDSVDDAVEDDAFVIGFPG